jgi:Tfp pilus assembly protein PilE
MKTDIEIAFHRRLMNNGKSWYCTDKITRRRIKEVFDFIVEAMETAERYYIGHTTQATRDSDYRNKKA